MTNQDSCKPFRGKDLRPFVLIYNIYIYPIYFSLTYLTTKLPILRILTFFLVRGVYLYREAKDRQTNQIRLVILAGIANPSSGDAAKSFLRPLASRITNDPGQTREKSQLNRDRAFTTPPIATKAFGAVFPGTRRKMGYLGEIQRIK